MYRIIALAAACVSIAAYASAVANRASISLGTEYEAKVEFLRSRQQDAHVNAENQSWPGWAVDQVKNLTTVYPWAKMHVSGASWFNLPGHAAEEARGHLFTLPSGEMKARYDEIYNELIQDNPSLARQFADNMVGMSTDERLVQDVLPIFQLIMLWGVVVAIYQRRDKMGFFSYLFNINKQNADPIQQKLAEMIIAAVERRANPGDILTFLLSNGWSNSEQGNRLTHALSMVRVFRADLYPRAQEMVRQIYVML
jgi:hypothetical protein